MAMSFEDFKWAFLTLIVILIAAFLIVKFVPQANDLFQEWVSDKSDLLPHERESAQDKYKEYFENKFLDELSDCRDSSNKECKCLKEELDIPGKFSLMLSKKNNFVEFNLINDQNVDFVGYPYVVNDIIPCLILKSGNFSFDVFTNSSLIYQKEDKSKIEYTISQNSRTFEKEVDDSFILYKLDYNKICIVEKSQISKLNNIPC